VSGPKPDPPARARAPAPGPAALAAALVELDRELDWELLGRLYCDEGGAGFFAPAEREAQRDAGLSIASDLVELLEREGVARASLYVGAGVAELVPALAEGLLQGRDVRLTNLPGPEPRELARGLAAVGERLGLVLPTVLAGELAELLPRLPARLGHVWMTSVLTDPEAFPALHRRAYGRPGLAPEHPARERARAAELVATALERLRPPALLTTTDEELPHVRPVARALGLALDVPGTGRLSAIVGDPLRHFRVRASGR